MSSPKKRVHFSTMNNATFELDFVEFDFLSVFYDEEEFFSMKKEATETLKLMDSPSFRETDLHCPRGLECRLKSAVKTKSRNRKLAKEAVLNEQKRQWKEQVHNPDLLAETYKGFSSHCLRRAQRMGASDAAVAKSMMTISSPVEVDAPLPPFKEESCDSTVSTVETASSSPSSINSRSSISKGTTKLESSQMLTSPKKKFLQRMLFASPLRIQRGRESE